MSAVPQFQRFIAVQCRLINFPEKRDQNGGCYIRRHSEYGPRRPGLVAFLLFLAQAVLAQQPTPILPEPNLTPGDTFEVTVQVSVYPDTAERCVTFRWK
jgi:hypothetical protein